MPKAFDRIPHDLRIAKRFAYGFSRNSVTFVYSYLKRQKQKVKINDFLSEFVILLSGVPQRFILNSISFHIFLNDLLSTLKLSKVYSFTDDNTISATFFFCLSITYFNKKVTVTKHCIFWCGWESTSKNLSKSQLDIGILNFDIIYCKT